MNILIVKLSSMGDVIHTLPAARAIRRANPDARLGWAVQSRHAGILDGQPWLDEIIRWDRPGWRNFRRFVGRLRDGRWDVAIDFQGLFRSGLIARLSGAPRRIGYAPLREKAHWFYNDRVPLKTMDEHAVERYHRLAETLAASTAGLPIERPYLCGGPPAPRGDASDLFPLYPTAEDRRQVQSWLADHGFDERRHRLVVLNPHCRKPVNMWPAGRFIELARRLAACDDVRVAVSGGGVSAEVCGRIAADADVWRADGRFSLLGTAELFSRAACVVTGDTGPMHIAAATGAPIVALFGPASALRTGPYASDAIVISPPLECSPCFTRRCPLKLDPPRCTDAITVAEVFEAVERQLSAPPTAARKSA